MSQDHGSSANKKEATKPVATHRYRGERERERETEKCRKRVTNEPAKVAETAERLQRNARVAAPVAPCRQGDAHVAPQKGETHVAPSRQGATRRGGGRRGAGATGAPEGGSRRGAGLPGSLLSPGRRHANPGRRPPFGAALRARCAIGTGLSVPRGAPPATASRSGVIRGTCFAL